MTKLKKDKRAKEKKSKKKVNSLKKTLKAKNQKFGSAKPKTKVPAIKDKSDAEQKSIDVKSKIQSETSKPKFTAEEQIERNNRTIFVGNLASNTKKQQLKKLLSQYGNMESCRFRRPNGKSILNKMNTENFANIIAYAVMHSLDEAEKCLALNGTEFKGNHIRVTKLEKTFAKDETAPKRTIFVGNLKYSATEEKLHNMFSTCGVIEYVRTINNDRGCIGCAYVCFENRESVGLALELDKTLLDDRPIRVEKYSANRKPKDSKKKPEKVVSGFERRMMKKAAKELGKKLEPAHTYLRKGANKTFGKKQNKKDFKKESKQKSLKKSNYRGSRADDKKKNKKSKKRDPYKELAKKIAPKT